MYWIERMDAGGRWVRYGSCGSISAANIYAMGVKGNSPNVPVRVTDRDGSVVSVF
jgi:hypothetical protein